MIQRSPGVARANVDARSYCRPRRGLRMVVGHALAHASPSIRPPRCPRRRGPPRRDGVLRRWPGHAHRHHHLIFIHDQLQQLRLRRRRAAQRGSPPRRRVLRPSRRARLRGVQGLRVRRGARVPRDRRGLSRRRHRALQRPPRSGDGGARLRRDHRRSGRGGGLPRGSAGPDRSVQPHRRHGLQAPPQLAYPDWTALLRAGVRRRRRLLLLGQRRLQAAPRDERRPLRGPLRRRAPLLERRLRGPRSLRRRLRG